SMRSVKRSIGHPSSGSGDRRRAPRPPAAPTAPQEAVGAVGADAPRVSGARRLEPAAGSASEAEGDGGLEAGSPGLPTGGGCLQYSTLSCAMLSIAQVSIAQRTEADARRGWHYGAARTGGAAGGGGGPRP